MIDVWFYIFLFLTPIVVFSVRPEATTKVLIGRLFIGVIIGYLLILAAVFVSEKHAKVVMDSFYHQFPECIDQRCGNTPSVYIDGPALAILTYLGWMISALYVGICECLWRLYYRKNIRNMGKAFTLKWLSNFFSGYAIFVFIVFPACVLLSYVILILFF